MPVRYAPGMTFDPATADLMGRVFEDAWKSLQQSGAPESEAERAEASREMIALRIIDRVAAGERDPINLRDDALAFVAAKSSEPVKRQR